MKGTLNKHEEGWLVRHGDMQFIPLHPDFIEMMDTCFTSKFTQVVDFEIVTEWENGEVGVNGLTYAKLINHSVDANEMIDHIGDANKMVEDDVQKLAVEEYPITKGGSMWIPTSFDLDQSCRQEGFINGYNKAKETLYTEEQVRDAIDMARDQSGYASYEYKENEIIQSLKQPKKD
jgi:hypothetical protein